MSDGGSVEQQPLPELEVGRTHFRLSNRILLASAASVVVALAVALAVAFPLVRSQAQSQAREELSRQADTVVSILLDGAAGRPVPGLGRPDGDRDRDGLRATVYVVDPASTPTSPIDELDIAAVIGGEDLSSVRQVGELTYFIEGRSLTPGLGVLLVQRDIVADGSAQELLSRMALALVVGLGVALLLALVVARRTARPLRAAVAAAEHLAKGERDVQLRVEGPLEVATLAQSLNQLAAALAISEDRQREFLMSVSHELRTPMTSINGYAEALADGVLGPDEIQGAGRVLMSEGERLERLISDLLDLARSGAVDFPLDIQATDLLGVAREAEKVWSLRCAKEGLSFEALLPDATATALVDRTRLRQAVDNLIENSVRVTPQGGRVRLSVATADGVTLICVEDDGPGLDESDLELAFDPGVLHSRYRKQRPVGTGLGLALVGRIVLRMGGRAKAGHSELGGAKFSLEFPSQPAQAGN